MIEREKRVADICVEQLSQSRSRGRFRILPQTEQFFKYCLVFSTVLRTACLIKKSSQKNKKKENCQKLALIREIDAGTK